MVSGKVFWGIARGKAAQPRDKSNSSAGKLLFDFTSTNYTALLVSKIVHESTYQFDEKQKGFIIILF